MEERSINFNNYESGAIDIIVVSEIYRCKEQLKENDFTYKEDKISCENFLKTLENIHNKLNK